MTSQPSIQDSSSPRGFRPVLLLFIIALALIWLFLSGSGALTSDLGGDPDEAAHAVTSLMIRDYLAEAPGQHPMKFAKAYYDHFPRVALGHYPPLYYLIAGPLLLPKVSIQVLFLLQALTLAGLAALTFTIGRRLMPAPLAAVAGLGAAALPVALKLVQHVMSDLMLALLCLWAAIEWANYLRTPTIRRALWWGIIAAAAILTKGSGMGLCLLPPLATVLAGEWRLLRTWSWWFAALPVAVLAGPWMLYSTGISKEGMTQLSPLQYFLDAVPFHLKAMPEVFGWIITLLALLGIAHGSILGWKRRRLSPEAASLLGLTVGIACILHFVPVGLSTRYLVTLAPVVMLAAMSGLIQLPLRSHLGKAALGIAVIITLVISKGLPIKEVSGFDTAVKLAGIPTTGAPMQNWLVSSDPRGEGAVIAAATFRLSQRAPANLRVYRGGKELSTSDWMGRGYRLAFDTPAALLGHLDARQITWIFVDKSMPEELRRPHDLLLEKALISSPSEWKLVSKQDIIRRPGQQGSILIYQRQTVSAR
jgi:hypothetical protein